MTPLSGWENFYVIVGSSAGALIGLQFVVITLIADMPGTGVAEASSAFGTPTIVHFATVLLLSAMLTIPWQSVGPAAYLWGLLGLIGMVYELIAARRMRIQKAYKPVLEDWVFYRVLPFAAYATVAGSAVAARADATKALFGVGAASLVLLFSGIRNVWDSVTYHVFVQRRRKKVEPPG